MACPCNFADRFETGNHSQTGPLAILLPAPTLRRDNRGGTSDFLSLKAMVGPENTHRVENWTVREEGLIGAGEKKRDKRNRNILDDGKRRSGQTIPRA